MKATTKAALTAIIAIGFGTSILATGPIQTDFLKTYPDARQKLGKCSTCHVKPMPKKDDFVVNAYGKDMAKALREDKKTYDYSKIAGLDSDGDGKPNADEIKAGTNPGDPNSK
ncbi:MAG: hypothetical protein IT186_10160 [Acidobacteria bacterium]|nr:hypothetical protein [Acidobacteriota bacterium]MCG3193155.1 hypothetical protein [Thermoanaerobaculia bacterium]MCK6685382.1 thrombospondin type 3 repeat-containing protein [Thermoanaerobaculia bacterium]